MSTQNIKVFLQNFATPKIIKKLPQNLQVLLQYFALPKKYFNKLRYFACFFSILTVRIRQQRVMPRRASVWQLRVSPRSAPSPPRGAGCVCSRRRPHPQPGIMIRNKEYIVKKYPQKPTREKMLRQKCIGRNINNHNNAITNLIKNTGHKTWAKQSNQITRQSAKAALVSRRTWARRSFV